MNSPRQLKYAFIIIFLIAGLMGHAQVQWVHDLTHAKSLAAGQGKLLVIDFWATWCGPCKTMDRKLWNDEASNSFKDKAVFVKIDIDDYTELAYRFGVKSIPDVRIIDVAENVYWQQNGFQNKNVFVNMFNTLPTELLNLNEYLLASSEKDATATTDLNTAKALLYVTAKLDSSLWKKNMFSESLKYLKRSGKKDKTLKKHNRLLEYAGMCLIGKTEKADQKLKKYKSSKLTPTEKEVYALVKSLIHMKTNNNTGFTASFSQVRDPFLKSLVRNNAR